MKVSFVFSASLLAILICCSQASVTTTVMVAASPSPVSSAVIAPVSSTVGAGAATATAGAATAGAATASQVPKVSSAQGGQSVQISQVGSKIVEPSQSVNMRPCTSMAVSLADCTSACCLHGKGPVTGAYCPHCNSTMWPSDKKGLFNERKVTNKTGHCTSDDAVASKKYTGDCEKDCPKSFYEAKCGAMTLVAGFLTLISLLAAILMTA